MNYFTSVVVIIVSCAVLGFDGKSTSRHQVKKRVTCPSGWPSNKTWLDGEQDSTPVRSFNLTKHFGDYQRVLSGIIPFDPNAIKKESIGFVERDDPDEVLIHNSLTIFLKKTPSKIRNLTGLTFAIRIPFKTGVFSIVHVESEIHYIKTGPETFGTDHKYQYLIISLKDVYNGVRVYARDVNEFNNLYREEVRCFLHSRGFWYGFREHPSGKVLK